MLGLGEFLFTTFKYMYFEQVVLCWHYHIFLHNGGVSDDILVPHQPHDVIGGKREEQLHMDRYPRAFQRPEESRSLWLAGSITVSGICLLECLLL